jgi:hypothetical protein
MILTTRAVICPNINRSVFVMEMQCVFCDVGIEYLNVVKGMNA